MPRLGLNKNPNIDATSFSSNCWPVLYEVRTTWRGNPSSSCKGPTEGRCQRKTLTCDTAAPWIMDDCANEVRYYPPLVHCQLTPGIFVQESMSFLESQLSACWLDLPLRKRRYPRYIHPRHDGGIAKKHRGHSVSAKRVSKRWNVPPAYEAMPLRHLQRVG